MLYPLVKKIIFKTGIHVHRAMPWTADISWFQSWCRMGCRLPGAAEGELGRQRQARSLSGVWKESGKIRRAKDVSTERKQWWHPVEPSIHTHEWVWIKPPDLNIAKFWRAPPQNLCLANTHSEYGEPKLTSDFPMLWGGHTEMPDSNFKLDPLSQIRSLRENQRFSFVAYPSICTLHRGLEITASLAPPWHCKISARANAGKHPEMATNQNHKGAAASLKNLGFAPS